MILMLYRPLQQHYFPYRYTLMDIGAVVLVLLGFYVWFVGAPPSLLRSYVMLAVGWVVLILGMELLSFQFLVAVAMILLALFPSLLVSLAFWLSVAGVFYIFLLLHYFGQRSEWLISLLIIPVGIFLLMLPIVHSLFGTTTECQMLSPLLSLLFVLFYPLAILLHLVGQGDLLDPMLQGLFTIECPAHESLLPWWMVAGYVGLSLAAIRYRWAFYGLFGTALLYAIYLFVL
jgi:competence protein ComEC